MDAIIESTPDFADPRTLAAGLVQIAATFKGRTPVEVLAGQPGVLHGMGAEADITDSAEYGELSTKD